MQLVLTELASTGWQFDGIIPLKLLQDSENGLVEGLHWLCSDAKCSLVLRQEHEDYKLDVAWNFEGKDRCIRCQNTWTSTYKNKITRYFSFETDDENRDKLEKPGHLNVLDFLKEEIWLAQNQSSLCNEQCKGLCSTCGANRNHESCRCDNVDVLHPFAGLSSLVFEKKD